MVHVMGPSIRKWPGVILEVSLVRILLHLDELLVLYLVSIYINDGLDTRVSSVTFSVSFLMPQRRIKSNRIQGDLVFSVIYLGRLSESLKRIKMLMLNAAAWVSFALWGVILVMTTTIRLLRIMRLEEITLSLSERIVTVVEVHVLCSTNRTIRLITELNWCNCLQSFRQIRWSCHTHSLDKNIWELHVLIPLLGSFISFANIIKPLKIMLLFLIKCDNLRVLIPLYLLFKCLYLEP